jgi:hypothetical protein
MNYRDLQNISNLSQQILVEGANEEHNVLNRWPYTSPYLQESTELDEEERPIYGRGGKLRRTETALEVLGKYATARDKKTKHNIPRGGRTFPAGKPDEGNPSSLFSGEYDRGKGSKAKRRAAALTKPEPKKSFPNRLRRSDKQGIKDSYDLYDIILSHLLDEGYAETPEQAQVIMVNMSEGWRESIMEAMKPLPVGKMIKQAAYKAYYASKDDGDEKVDKQVAKMAKVADTHNPNKSKRKEDDNRREGGRKRDAGRPRSNELQDNL